MLVCAHCGSGSIILEKEFVYGQGWIERPKCLKCSREKFVERENPAKIIRTELVERVKEEAKTMGKSGQCKFEGCDKVRLAGGYCYRHYKEVNGHPYKGGLKNHKGGNIEMPGKVQDMVTVEVHSEGPFVIVRLEPETIEALRKRAKAEYRTAEQQAAYILHKELSA